MRVVDLPLELAQISTRGGSCFKISTDFFAENIFTDFVPRTLSLYQFFHLLRIKGNWWTKIPECWSQNHKNQKWQSNALPAKYCNFHQLLMGVQFIFNVVWESRKNYMAFVHNVFHLQFLNLIFSALGRRAAMAPPSWETSSPVSSR